MFSRRKVIAGVAALPVAIPAANIVAQTSTPVASPVASPVVDRAPTTAEILPAWQDAQGALRQLGQSASEAFWQYNSDALIASGTDELSAALEANPDIQMLVESYTTDQVLFAFPEVGASVSGHYTSEGISGVFFQGAAIPWEAEPEEAQTEAYPTGSWTGVIGPGIVDLGIKLEFAGNAENLEIMLAIPTQFLPSTPMSDVAFHTEIPVGEMLDERVVPAGGAVILTNLYAEEYEWGDHTLKLDMVWTGDGALAGINLVPQFSLPDVPAQEPITARLPFDGAWMVFWGGDSEFRNYHAPVPSQRFAADIAIWQDGSTAAAPGTDNMDYYAFGQPYLAPVDGTIFAVMDGMEDIAPQQPGSNPTDHPAGNHIVIEVDGGYVYLAHCQNGSILVQEGDTVTAGDVVAAVGNSGNTSEAHVHIHAQTHPDMFDPQSQGIPLVFEGAMENGESVEQLSILHGTIVEHRS